MNLRLAVLVAVASLVALGCATKPAQPAPNTNAAVMFQKNCATCHGPNGDGLMVASKAVPSLKIGKPVTDPDAQLLKQITNGGNGMPPFKYTLTDDEIRQLLKYVRNELQQQKKS